MLNRDFVWLNKLPKVARERPITVNTADGNPIKDAGKEYTEEVILRIMDHQEELAWEISPLEKGIGSYPPISMLAQHNPDVQ